MRYTEWLASLKPGDKVAICTGYYGCRVDAVSRVTNTQIVVGASRFRKVNGRRVGDTGMMTASIDPVDDPRVVEMLDRARRGTLRDEVERAARQATTAALESALAILKASHPADATVPS